MATVNTARAIEPITEIALATQLNETDLDALVEATEAAIRDGSANWVKSPGRAVLQSYWKGLMMAPHRDLLVARLDGIVCGALQLLHPQPMSESGGHAAELASFFVAPWARGHGLGRLLIDGAERQVKRRGLTDINFAIRADRQAALGLANAMGFDRWAVKPRFAEVGGKMVPGYFFTKQIG